MARALKVDDNAPAGYPSGGLLSTLVVGDVIDANLSMSLPNVTLPLATLMSAATAITQIPNEELMDPSPPNTVVRIDTLYRNTPHTSKK